MNKTHHIEKDDIDFHCIDICLDKCTIDTTVRCPICNRNMKRVDYNLFLCNPNTRTSFEEKYLHYNRYKPQPIDLIEKYQLNFSEGCFVKYMLRSEFKGDKLQDLKKALYYLNRCKMPSFRRAISYADLNEYYQSEKFSPGHINCVLSFISGHSFGITKIFLQNEICGLVNESI